MDSAHPAAATLTPTEQALAGRIARFQHANESLHRHPNDGDTCDYCNLVGVYAVLTIRRHAADTLAALSAAGAVEPFGFVWRPKPGSRRWVHRMARESRGFPAGSEFVDVYRLVEEADRG